MKAYEHDTLRSLISTLRKDIYWPVITVIIITTIKNNNNYHCNYIKNIF